MQIKEITDALEAFAPLNLQEDYDNCGLLTGQKNWECTGALLTLDCIEAIIDEALQHNCNLIIAHHPIIFSGLKKINGNNYIERTIIKAIQNNIAIYAAHTNFDNIKNGVNKKMAEKLGLQNLSILSPKNNLLKKLVTFVPETHHQKVLDTLFDAGCGNIGNYENCSFNTKGTGTFKGNENTNPFIGKPNQLSVELEIRVETIFESHKQNQILTALKASHPYEEVAYDIYSLSNSSKNVGSGMVGELEKEMYEDEFLNYIKHNLKSNCLKHTQKLGKSIKKVAICGGSGQFLLKNAINNGADAFITSDFKYHQFFEVENQLLLIDAGHYETEQFTPEIFYDIIKKKFVTFAVRLSKINTNPINYF